MYFVGVKERRAIVIINGICFCEEKVFDMLGETNTDKILAEFLPKSNLVGANKLFADNKSFYCSLRN